MYLHNGKTTDRLLTEAYELSKIPDNRELDVLLSSGEQISISKLSILLKELGYDAISLTGWQAGIITNNTNQNAVIENIDVTRIEKELSKHRIVIIAGFQGVNERLDITTLGRGGSDTTAVAVAAVLNAKHCYIYSDVDGVYTTDPNKYSEAKKLGSLSYVEMLDIANEGAKVLHNRCIEIGEKYRIPIITKSTFNNEPGSVINDKIENKIVKSIVKNDDIILLRLKKDDYSIQMFYKIYELLISNDILPIHIINKSTDIFNCEVLIKNSDLNKLNKLLEAELIDYTASYEKISRISVIGYGITTDNSFVKIIIDEAKKYDYNVFSVDITNAKIIITFKELIDNTLIEKLHNKLFE